MSEQKTYFHISSKNKTDKGFATSTENGKVLNTKEDVQKFLQEHKSFQSWVYRSQLDKDVNVCILPDGVTKLETGFKKLKLVHLHQYEELHAELEPPELEAGMIKLVFGSSFA